MLTGIFTVFLYRRNRAQRRKLSKTTHRIQSLEKKVNLAFEEVAALAKGNDPSFMGRFREVYPVVYKNLTDLKPDLNNSEIHLCALVWLGFSTKDIARYTHIQPKSVQMKKYRLRKKMNLPNGTNLYDWIKDL